MICFFLKSQFAKELIFVKIFQILSSHWVGDIFRIVDTHFADSTINRWCCRQHNNNPGGGAGGRAVTHVYLVGMCETMHHLYEEVFPKMGIQNF